MENKYTFEEVKKMNGYKFWSEYESMEELKNHLKSSCDVIAVLELPFIDIEWTSRGFDNEQKDEYPFNDYFCCIRSKSNIEYHPSGWVSHDNVDFGKVHPTKLNTIEELERDMFEQLIKYANTNNLNLFEWNE